MLHNSPICQHYSGFSDVFNGEFCLSSRSRHSAYSSGQVVPFQWLHCEEEEGEEGGEGGGKGGDDALMSL